MSEAISIDNIIKKNIWISVAANALMSGLFFFLTFGLEDRPLAVGMPDNFAFDMLPQSFFVGFLSAFVPSLITARDRKAGKITEVTPQELGVSQIFLRAILIAILAVTLGALIMLAMLTSGFATFSYLTALSLKICYGAALGALITPRALRFILDVRKAEL
jgi:hypothetical protein